MATHFARGILKHDHLIPLRLSDPCHSEAKRLPEHRRIRFLASRTLLAELMFMLYGIGTLPEIVTLPDGRPRFKDDLLPRFSLAYTGNMVGVALTTEGECGLDMELQRASHGFQLPRVTEKETFSSNETLWINNQNDPSEARSQLNTLRRSVLKLSGNLHNTDPTFLQLLPGVGRLRLARPATIEAICDAEDVLVWSVAVSPAIERLKIWEYDSLHGWTNLPDAHSRINETAGRLMRFTSLPMEKGFTPG